MKNTNKKQGHIRIGKTQRFGGQMINYTTQSTKQPKSSFLEGKFWIFLLLGLVIGMSGCKIHQPTVIEKEKLIYVTKDSIVHRDSLVYMPVEVYKDYSLDTLVLQTSLAISKSWLDTSSAYLVGEIRNLKAVQIKYVEVDKWHTKDSIVEKTKEVPVEVVVEKVRNSRFATACIVWSIVSLILIGLLIYLKIKKPI